MPVINNSVFVIDNGAYQLKAGYCSDLTPRIMPNCICKAKSDKRRAFIGDQIDECRDLSSLYYMLPFQRGYLTNWDHQKTVLDYLFGKSCFKIVPSETDLLFTEPYFNFISVQDGLDELFFEEYAFRSVMRTHTGDLSCFKHRIEQRADPDHLNACLVVEVGYSFCHVVPFICGKRIREAVKRIDVGGKLLTNRLKEIISYRQIHVLDESYVMNCAKEDCCFVSLDFDADMRKAAGRQVSSLMCEYVLPDFTNIRRGFVRSLNSELTQRRGPSNQDDEQIIRMNNERFCVPEILFNPSDIGIEQMGLAELIVYSISLCPEEFRPWLYKNILLTGGSTKFPNFKLRLQQEIRQLAPSIFDIEIILPDDPISYAWYGGASLGQNPAFQETLTVERSEYLERGHIACHEKYLL